MLRLIRTTCAIDWKGRPDHNIAVLGADVDQAKLLALMDQDVEETKAEDLAQDREDAEEGETPNTEWTIENERWEMDRNEQTGPMRKLVWRVDEGDTTTVCYHIQSIGGRQWPNKTSRLSKIRSKPHC